MSKPFYHEYRRKPLRLQSWDYASGGWYFVTICTRFSKEHFGAIKSGEMNLNRDGMVARNCWRDIPQHFPVAELDAFVIMPDHIHGILALGNIGLGDVVGSYKSAVSKLCREAGNTSFGWQKGYHEHVIRSEKALDRIRNYIMENPVRLEMKHHEGDILNLL